MNGGVCRPTPTPALVDPRLCWGSLGSLPQLLLHASSSESRDPQWQELAICRPGVWVELRSRIWGFPRGRMPFSEYNVLRKKY